MMIKGLALLLIGVFLVMTRALSGVSPGLSFLIVVIFSLLIGWSGFLGLILPPRFRERLLGPLMSGLPQSAETLALELQSICLLIRQDGLLVLEARRKELKDVNLRYLLKRITEGFEAKDIEPFLRNQSRVRLKVMDEVQALCSQFYGIMTGVGLLSSLILLMSVLASQGQASSKVGISESFIPFAVALFGQMLVEAWLSKDLEARKREDLLYFEVLEEGILGIQKGVHPDFLRDRIRSRIEATPKWQEI